MSKFKFRSNLLTITFIFVTFFVFAPIVHGQNKEMNDGPYIEVIKDSIRIRWVEKGLPYVKTYLSKEAKVFNQPLLPIVDLTHLDVIPEEKWEYPQVNKYVVLGDPHGKFDEIVALLKAHHVIDSLGNWAYEDNHAVVIGDYFSRGDKVMEVLWFLFQLEKQASNAGGKLHIMLGNHEIMTLGKDLRYLHKNYLYTSGALQINYAELFSTKTVLGKWLRSKNMIVSINDNLMVHAGLSPTLVKANLDAEFINHFYRDSILPFLGSDYPRSPLLDLLEGNDAPIWYRGYADSLTFQEASIDSVLQFYNVSSVTVGHTIMPEITVKFGGKIMMIDCGFFTGSKGELLVYKNEQFYRGLPNGKTSSLIKNKGKKKTTLFDAIYNMGSDGVYPKIVIHTNLKDIVKAKMKEEEQPSTFELYTHKDSLVFVMSPKVRSRGNMRKQVCYFPPLKFNFAKKELAKFGLKSADKLKMVLVCRDGDKQQEKLLQEYFIYKLYEILDSNAIRAKLIDFKFINEKNETTDAFTGLMVEDDDTYAMRFNARILDSKGVLNSTGLERNPFLITYFFQYMISNTDWSIGNKHNVMIAKLPQYQRLVALPYDYDYSGFVDQSYAVPDPSLPIKSVRDRHLMPYVISNEEFDFAVQYFASKKQSILDLCQQATFLKPQTIKENISFLTEFFKEIENPEKLRKYIKTK